MNPSDYVTFIPEKDWNNGTLSCSHSGNNSQHNFRHLNNPVWKPPTLTERFCSSAVIEVADAQFPKISLRRKNLYKRLNRNVVKDRFNVITAQFPELDWPSLVKEKFILVSFGSVAQAHNMPLHLVQKIFFAFSRSPYKVIWQTNSVAESLVWIRNESVPKNVVMINWAPIKEMLAHPNLQYLICHGGINTINELLLFGVPVI
ncbi:hypothetical protein NECAME_09508, partial [Necator americanus]